MDFALRNFQKHDLIKSQIKVYGYFGLIFHYFSNNSSMMGLYSDAVSLALDNNMIEDAKDLASKPEGSSQEVEDLKKKLWLQVINSILYELI